MKEEQEIIVIDGKYGQIRVKKDQHAVRTEADLERLYGFILAALLEKQSRAEARDAK